MSDNFDLKKYLVENKVTANSRMLSEAEDMREQALAFLEYLREYRNKLKTTSQELKNYLKNGGYYVDGVVEEVDADIFKLENYLEGDEDITEMKKKHSKMMNEAETLNLHDMDEDTLDELYIKHITNNAIDSEKYLVSKGATPEEAKEIVDEDGVIEGLKELGVTMTHITTLEVGGTYIDNYKVYDLSDGNVAVEEDYLGMVTIVPMKAFEDFKKAL